MAEQLNLGSEARLTWYGDELLEHAKKQVARQIRIAAEYLKAKVQRNLSTSTRKHGASSEGEFPHADTGKLRQSIFTDVDDDKLEGIVGSPLTYAQILEYGSPGGTILRPVNAKALSWIDADTGERRFARSVRQGGIKGRSFLRRTLVEEEAQVRAILEARWPDMPGSFRVGA